MGLTFTALQSASLCLVTTPPERMAAALGVALTPLRALGVPVREMVLTLLLALRFMNTVRGCCCVICGVVAWGTPCHLLQGWLRECVTRQQVGWQRIQGGCAQRPPLPSPRP